MQHKGKSNGFSNTPSGSKKGKLRLYIQKKIQLNCTDTDNV